MMSRCSRRGSEYKCSVVFSDTPAQLMLMNTEAQRNVSHLFCCLCGGCICLLQHRYESQRSLTRALRCRLWMWLQISKSVWQDILAWWMIQVEDKATHCQHHSFLRAPVTVLLSSEIYFHWGNNDKWSKDKMNGCSEACLCYFRM